MKIALETANLRLAHTFETSRSATSVSRSYFLHSDGAVGEGSPVRFYGEIPESYEAAHARLVPEINGWEDPRTLWPRLNKALGYNFAVKCGFDLLFWDHLGKKEGTSVRELLEIKTVRPLTTALSIGIASPAEMQAEVKRNAQFQVYKLKVGFENDIEVVEAVREVTEAPLYVDANGGWSTDEACRKLPRLAELGVVMCEQPLFSGERADWERVRAATDMPLVVDEHCHRPEDVAHWAGWVDGINVKLQKCGGITPAFEMIQRARDCGLQVMIGCMIESSVSIAAAAQLAPLADSLDLDSNLYLAADPYDGIPCAAGELIPSGKPGLGVWKREAS
jgi:L-alanine-DL-glutamate epimerase-like enolase superfamily enzyme